MKAITGLVLFVSLLMPLAASAETVLRVGSDITVEPDQVVNGDYYVSVGPFGRTTMSGAVAGDMLVFAGKAVLNGSITDDLFLVAGTGEVHASTTGAVRMLAGEATISEAVGGDVFMLGGTLTILPTAMIAGNVYFFGGDAKINGTVGGGVFGAAERVSINGSVAGSVDVRVPAGLVLGDAAEIGGDVTYTSLVPLMRSQSSVVEGTVLEQATPTLENREIARTVLTPLFVILFASLSLFLLFRRGLQRLVNVIDDSLLLAGGIGAAVIIAAPIVATLLLVTVLGILLGVMLLGGLIVLYTVALALTGVVTGAFMMKFIRGSKEVTLPSILLGSVAVHLCMLIPIVGIMVVVSIFILTLGGLTRSVYVVLKTEAE